MLYVNYLTSFDPGMLFFFFPPGCSIYTKVVECFNLALVIITNYIVMFLLQSNSDLLWQMAGKLVTRPPGETMVSIMLGNGGDVVLLGSDIWTFSKVEPSMNNPILCTMGFAHMGVS